MPIYAFLLIDLEYRLVTGIYVLGFNGLYYWGFLKRFIFRKQYFYLGGSIVAYIFLVQFGCPSSAVSNSLNP